MTVSSAVPASPPLPASHRSSRRAFWARIILAGPLAALASVLVMAGGALWLPKGAASIDNLVLPIALFPAIWAALFFYASLDRRLGRAYLIVAGIALANAALIGISIYLSKAAA